MATISSTTEMTIAQPKFGHDGLYDDPLVRVFISLITSIMAVLASSAGVLGLYFVKSMLGIDLFEGPSIFHDIFFD